MSESVAHTSATRAQAERVHESVQRGAAQSGVDFSYLIATAQRESALNPHARAGTSSATGLFQFIDSTWLDMVRRHGAEHGLGAYAQALQSGDVSSHLRSEILALRTEPELSARMAGVLARENAAAINAAFGRAPSAGELYAAHFLGAGGAIKLIKAAEALAPDASAVFPREAAANRAVFFNADGSARSAREVLTHLDLDVGSVRSPALAPSSPAAPDRMAPSLMLALWSAALQPLLGPNESEPINEASAFQAYRRNSNA